MSWGTPNDYDALYQACREWWEGLQELEKDGEVVRPRNRAELAELRRLDVTGTDERPTVLEALSIAAFRKLIQRLEQAYTEQRLSNPRLVRWLIKPSNEKDEDKREFEPFIISAATLARVREDCGKREAKRGETARLLGAPRSEGADKSDPLFAEARFKRLIRTRDDWPGLMSQARRIAAILEREAPIGDLGASLILWNADTRVVRDWAFQYYGREFEPAEPRDESAASTNT